MHFPRTITLIAGVVFLAVTGCTPGKFRKVDLRSASVTASTVLLLVFDPADCFACGIDMAHWTTLRRRDPKQIKLLLTRVPTREEAKVFARYRIQVDGLLTGAIPPKGPGGLGLLFRSGGLVLAGRINEKSIQALLTQELTR